MDTRGQPVDCSDCTLDVACLNRLVPDEKGLPGGSEGPGNLQGRGETLCKEGANPSGVKTVLEGFVKVFVEGPDQKEYHCEDPEIQVISLVLSSICGCVTYSYTGIALNDCLVCSIET